MTSNLETIESNEQVDYLNEFPGEVEMSLFDHLEELRLRSCLTISKSYGCVFFILCWGCWSG